MSGAQFDPAPWSVEPNNDAGSPPSIMVTTQDAVVAEVYAHLAASEPSCIANARLIAAAPELYEALEHAIELLESGRAECAPPYMGELLAEARGETP